jgi:glycerol-3-phosphate acyltransferase PlsY
VLEMLLWSVVGYLSGSVLYSKLIAKYVLKVDIGAVGDGNPGSTNVAKAGGAKWAAVAFLLDVLKAALPVGIPYFFLGMNDPRILVVALMPAIGHAYPLYFGFKGGKAIAAISGAWVGLATWELITVGGLLLLYWYLSVKSSAWATIFMVTSIGLYLYLTGKPPLFYGFWLLSLAFLSWTHRHDLRTEYPGVGNWPRQVASQWH